MLTSTLRRAQGLHQQGALAEATKLYRQVLRAQPRNIAARYNVGLALLQQGRHAAGLADLQRAAELAPDRAGVWYSIAKAHAALGQEEAAEQALRRAVGLDPGHLEAGIELANILIRTDRAAAAEELLGELGRRAPDHDAVGPTLGLALAKQGRWDAAATLLTQVVERAPANRMALRNLIQVENRLKRADRVLTLAARYLELAPDDAGIRATWAMTGLYVDGDASEALRRARRWRPAPAGSPIVRHDNPPDPERRLRVGLVSRDLRRHPVGFFVRGFVEQHDRERIELHAFSGTRPDGLTGKLRVGTEHWHEVADLGDGDLLELIRDAGIDILVDLSGISAHNRLAVFAARPAPIGITGFGHFGTTGLDDHYLLSDPLHTPAGFERGFSETVLRLSRSYISYTPPENAPDVAPRPLLRGPGPTFGCFNNPLKLSDQTLALWARVLAAVPTASLLLRDRAFEMDVVRADFRRRFAAAGVSSDRLRFAGGAPHADFLGFYREVDVALDPHPYAGGLTTLEALWMGVPVVTLAGRTFCSRHSTSHLGNLGLDDLVCASAEAYVETARALASDGERLARLRAELRPRLAASTLCDSVGYARDLEECLRNVWRDWCRRAPERA